jgi:hypothetical protein
MHACSKVLFKIVDTFVIVHSTFFPSTGMCLTLVESKLVAHYYLKQYLRYFDIVHCRNLPVSSVFVIICLYSTHPNIIA